MKRNDYTKCMSVTVCCPECGFPSRPLCSDDGKNWKYVCPRCHAIFWP